MPQLSPILLSVLCVALGIAAGWAADVTPALRRARWLFISIVGVYGLTQPGPPGGEIYQFGASVSGLLLGLEQAAQLALLIGALVWLFPKAARAELLYAIYLILLPLRIIRVDAERVAIRLALTMHLALESRSASLAELLLPDSHSRVPALISLPRAAFRATDCALIFVLIAATFALLW